MKLKSARIRNFRCIREAEISFNDMTSFIGGNGAGKSTVLRAIDAFYAGAPKITVHDYFNRKTDNSIEIDLTFHQLTEAEVGMFGSRVDGGELSVMRVFDWQDGARGRYFGTSLIHQDFAELRALAGMPKRNAYGAFRAARPEYNLPSITAVAQVDVELARWEAEHPERCVRGRDDGQFFGFTNNANGKLQRATSFVFIPAVRDAAVDAIDSGRAPVARLMELVVRSAIERRSEVQAFRREVSDRYRALMDPANLPELNGLAGEISGTLKTFYENAAVSLQWQEISDIDAPPPNAHVELEEDSYRSPVDRTGHGLQRAFVLSLLQHLALASSRADEGEVATEVQERGQLPGLILAIEEPELYQHPTKQRHFANVLSQLANGHLSGVARQMQVVVATHSPLFVRLSEFGNVRLARRIANQEGGPRESRIKAPEAYSVCQTLENIHQAPAGSYTASGLLPRLHIMNAEVCEGFFANVAVLVEGASDRSALFAAATAEGFDFEAEGIAIIPCGAANNIDRPAAIFRELGIPTYIVWDGDGGAKHDQQNRNRALQRLVGIQEAEIVGDPAFVSARGAVFAKDLETSIAQDLGNELFQAVLKEQVEILELEDRNNPLKMPACMFGVLHASAARGFKSATLGNIVSAIRALRQTPTL